MRPNPLMATRVGMEALLVVERSGPTVRSPRAPGIRDLCPFAVRSSPPGRSARRLALLDDRVDHALGDIGGALADPRAAAVQLAARHDVAQVVDGEQLGHRG